MMFDNSKKLLILEIVNNLKLSSKQKGNIKTFSTQNYLYFNIKMSLSIILFSIIMRELSAIIMAIFYYIQIYKIKITIIIKLTTNM